MFLRLLHSRYPGTPLPRKCLQLGATCFQPGTPSLGITHRGACRCWASCHPQDPLLPDSHSPVSSSLQPLCSTNQPSCTGLMKGCEAEPPVLLQLVPCSTSPPKPTPIHPQASFLDSYRGHSKAHSKVMLKLVLFCKEQKHLKANTQKDGSEDAPQTSTKADSPSLHSRVLARSFTFWHHILPSTPSQAHSPTFTVPHVQGRHDRHSSSTVLTPPQTHTA